MGMRVSRLSVSLAFSVQNLEFLALALEESLMALASVM